MQLQQFASFETKPNSSGFEPSESIRKVSYVGDFTAVL
jgi:hypothetical protein